MTHTHPHRAVNVGVAVLVAFALGQPSLLATASIVAASVLTLVGLALIAKAAARPTARGELAVSSRARAHRESLGEQAEPAHPLTPGRPLSRAPGVAASAA